MNILSPSLSRPKFVLSIIALMFLYIIPVSSQTKKNKAYEKYIDKYNAIAVEHMRKHRIPASITLAQGLLESGAGLSRLAQEGNNHFGIKCHSEWTGATMRKSDDSPNECFRKYKKVEDSYHDHSMFLTQRSRYGYLFDLNITDYRGWAKGLQKAGYATDKAYANKLIKLIEDYGLYEYDKNYKKDKGVKQENSYKQEEEKIWNSQKESTTIKRSYSHTPYITHGLVYVIAQDGDTYEAIAEEFNFKAKDLYKYNEVPRGFPLEKGDLVYFQSKKKKSDKPYYEHVVRIGESMHTISQIYGIKVNNLYKMNKKDYEYVPVEGDILRLR